MALDQTSRMLISFDLIAVILCVAGLEQYFAGQQLTAPAWGSVLTGFSGCWLVTWLLNEWLVRRVEWLTRFGLVPEGLGGRHPIIFYTWGLRAVQALTVALYALLMWSLVWPAWVHDWPLWLGLSEDAHLWHLQLAQSSVVVVVLDLAPFLTGMLIAWIPRRRLASRLQHRPVPLFGFLMQEVRLSWVPLILWLLAAALADAQEMLPREQTVWLKMPGVDLLAFLAGVLVLAAVVLPKLIVWWWQCRPIPDGPLRSAIEILMRRSGIRARGLLHWGPRSTPLLNACVLGPWARFRYVLISPRLIDELTPEETLGVMAHELGHARHGHLSLFFVLLLAMPVVLDPLAQMFSGHSPLAQTGFILVFMALYLWGFLGAITRQCEREADLASAELMGTPLPLIAALEKLALSGGNTRKIWNWHHGSIAGRIEAVAQLSAEPERARRFHARQRLMRTGLSVLTAAAIAADFYRRLA